MVLVSGKSHGDNETHLWSNKMRSEFSQPTGTGSLGETRRPRTLEEPTRYKS